MKVAIVVRSVVPSQLPLLRTVSETPRWRVRVLTDAHADRDEDQAAASEALDVLQVSGWAWKRTYVHHEPIRYEQEETVHVPVGLWGELSIFEPDVVVSAGLGPRSIIAQAWCSSKRRPHVLWVCHSRASVEGLPERGAFFRKRLLRKASSIVAGGAQAREVLHRWGAADEKIIDAPHAANHTALARWRADPRLFDHAADVRALAQGKRLAVVMGGLLPVKGVHELLRAWGALEPAVRDRWCLLFVGDGPLEPLVREASSLGVRWTGRVGEHAVVACYTAADLHIAPTVGDAWGVAVNEASHCGTPTLCSVHAGCCEDMVTHGKNGLVFDPRDPVRAIGGLSAALTRNDLHELGMAARAHAALFTLDRFADGFRKAVSLVDPDECGVPARAKKAA